MNTTISKYINKFNHSPILAGISMIILNIGSKYVELGFSKTQEQALKASMTREILIFSMVFVATKDITLSIMMTASFIILSNYIFNEKSRFCIASGYLKGLMQEIDRNGDNVISKEEEQWAIKILQKARQNENKSQQSLYV